MCLCVSTGMTYKEMIVWLSVDEFSLSLSFQKWAKKKKSQTHFSFSPHLAQHHQSAAVNHMENHGRELSA